MSAARTWYAIRTATRQESKVIDHLKEIGVEAYMPARTFWRRLRSTKTKADAPLFVGYVFIFCGPADFYRVSAVEGFHQYVRFMNDADELEPMPFPDEAIGDIMARQTFGEFDETTKTPERYQPRVGDRAVVTGGKWRGYIAEVLSLPAGKRKAQVVLEGIGGGRMTLDVGHLSAA